MISLVNEKYCDSLVRGEGWVVGDLKSTRNLGSLRDLGGIRTGTLCGHFDGLRTYIDTVDKEDYRFGHNTAYDSSTQERGGSDWCRFKTYREAIKAFRETPEVFRNFTESDIRLKDWESAGNDVEYGNTGDFIDIGRALTGDPEPFGVMRDGNIINRFCSIIVNASMYWGVSSEEAELKAQRITRLVDLLETNHIRCQVIAIWSDNVSHIEVVVKRYGDIVDLDDISVVFSADLLRRTGFKFKERSMTCESCYGSVEIWGTNGTRMFNDEMADHTIVIDGINSSNHHKDKITRAFDALESRIAEKWEVGDNYNVVF